MTNNENISFIYGLKDPASGLIRYIGRSNYPEGRLATHMSEARRGVRGEKCDWIRALFAQGLQPDLVVLEKVVGSNSDAEAAEKRWFDLSRHIGALCKYNRGGGAFPGSGRKTAPQRFWVRVDKNGPFALIKGKRSRCWLWTGAKNKAGYGVFNIRPRRSGDSGSMQAHHWSYAQVFGSIPEGFESDHLCCNPSCVRPGHIEVVSHVENLKRRRLGPRTHCKQGHEFTERNTYRHPVTRKSYCRVCSLAASHASKRRRWQEVMQRASDYRKRKMATQEGLEVIRRRGREYAARWREKQKAST